MFKNCDAWNSTTNTSIVSTNDLFSIDSETGWVVTNVVLSYDNYDFDNYDGDFGDDETKFVELSIKATDKDQLEDVCTLSVSVKKKNVDNTQSVFFPTNPEPEVDNTLSKPKQTTNTGK